MSSSSRPAAPAGTWRIGRFSGVDILIRPSLLLMGAVLVAVFAPRFEERSGSNPYVLATTFVIALYVSVLIHELAHVVVARSFRMRVQSVTLHLLGGETLIEGESRSPWQELATSIAGPLASLAIGVVALWASGAMTENVAADILWSIGYVNILVAIFNMLPGLPLDGGRVFRALIWQLTGNEATGVRIAAWIGRVAAVAIVVVALVRQTGSDRVFNVVVALLIGWFLWQGAGDALRHVDHSARVALLVARSLAVEGGTPPPGSAPLPADLRGADLLNAMSATPAETYALTEADGSIYGVLTARAVDDAYRKSRR